MTSLYALAYRLIDQLIKDDAICSYFISLLLVHAIAREHLPAYVSLKLYSCFWIDLKIDYFIKLILLKNIYIY